MKLRWLGIASALALGCAEAGQEAATEEQATRESAAPAESPLRIEVGPVESAVLSARIAASGTLEARRITEVAAEVPGRIEAVLVEVGDDVAEGAPLFRIEAAPYQLAAAEARAALSLARAESENAVAEAARMAKLMEQSAASQQRADQVRTQAEVARARVAQAEARLAKVERDLAQTVVRAPYASSVVERRAHEGAMAGGAAVLVIQEQGALEAILDVPEASPVGVRAGDPISLFVEGVADPIVTTVTRVNGRLDPGTRTYEVRADVVDASDVLKAGAYARAEIHPSRDEARPVIERSSLLARDGRSYVLRVEGGVVRHVAVRVGIVDGERVEILEGLAAGDLVVRGGAVKRLADGTRVKVSGSAAEIVTAQAKSADAKATP